MKRPIMRKFKILFVAAITILFFNVATAQSKTKTTTTKTTTRKVSTAKQYQCPMKCEGEKTYSKPGKCPVCKMALAKVPKAAKTAAAYKCPMSCEGDKTYAKAGKCPVCNMNLAKVDQSKMENTTHENH